MKYSVMRIEQAKQRALTGRSWKAVKPAKHMEMDWTGEDEEALCDLIDQWDPDTGHAGLNKLIDGHKFSGGTHYVNADLGKLFIVEQEQMGPGTIQYKQYVK